MEEIKKILHIRNIEDFYGYKVLFNIIILCFLFFLSLQDLQFRISAHVFTLWWISINSFQVFTLFSRHNFDFILCECPKSNRSVFLMFLWTCMLENLIFAVFLFGHLIFAMHTKFLYALLFTSIHFCYAIAIGRFIGTLSKHIKGLIPIVLFYILCIFGGGWWTDDEKTRFWSPSTQLYNVNIINITNTVALVALIITFMLISRLIYNRGMAHNRLKIAGITCLYAFALIGLISRELSYNKKIENSAFNKTTATHQHVEYKGVNEHDTLVMAKVIDDMEEELIKLKFINNKADKYQFNKYYVSDLFFLYHNSPIPVLNEDKIIYVNVFSDAMINFNEHEIVRDMMIRTYDHLLSEASDNNYTYDIQEGCREHILKTVILKNPEIYSEDLIDWLDKVILKSDQYFATQYTFLRIMASGMYDKYPEELAELYTIIEKESPQDDMEVLKILEDNFPELLKEFNIQQLFNTNIGGK